MEIILKIVRKLSIQGFQFFDRYNIDLNLATDITILKMAIKSIILKLNQHQRTHMALFIFTSFKRVLQNNQPNSDGHGTS